MGIALNAKEYSLRYTIRDGIELRKRLGRPGIQIMRDLMGLDQGGQMALTFDLDALVACITVGVRHQQKATEDTVTKWIQEHIDNGKLIGELVTPVIEALNAGRCFGFKLQGEEPEEGKEQSPETTLT